MRTVSKADLPGGSDASSRVTAQVHGEPADDHGHGAVQTAGHHEQGAVLDVPVRDAVDVEEYGESGDGDQDRDRGEGEAVPDLVRDEGDEQREAEGCCPWGDGIQLRGDF